MIIYAAWLAFVIMPLAGLAFAIRTWLFLQRAVRTTAKIRGYKEESYSSSDCNETTYLPQVFFHDEQGIYREVTLSHERPTRAKGIAENEVRIVYRPGAAKQARLDYWGYLWLPTILLCSPAAILLIVFSWMYVIAKLGL